MGLDGGATRQIPEWHALPQWRAIDLLSDVHLHADMPRTFEAWRTHMLGTPAQAILILGDLFEVWVGDDARHGAFENRCLAVLREASKRSRVAFMPGNRDFLVGDTLLRECGIERLEDPTALVAWGRRLLLSHGDALCLGDADYQRFRREVRSDAWQRSFLTLPLDERQRRARSMRDASAAHQASQGPMNWADVDDTEASRWLVEADAATLVHGHTHRPSAHALPHGRQRVVLGDWDFDGARPRAHLLRVDSVGLHPIDLAGA